MLEQMIEVKTHIDTGVSEGVKRDLEFLLKCKFSSSRFK